MYLECLQLNKVLNRFRFFKFVFKNFLVCLTFVLCRASLSDYICFLPSSNRIKSQKYYTTLIVETLKKKLEKQSIFSKLRARRILSDSCEKERNK